MIKAGRFTAGAIMVAFGIGLLLNQITDTDYISAMFRYWPLILIALGVEYLIISAVNRKGDRQVQFAFMSVVGAVVISFVVGTLVQGQLLFNVSADGVNFLKGKRFEKETYYYAPDSSTQNIKIENMLGDVTIEQGEGDRIEVRTIVYVRHGNEASAQKIADQSEVRFVSGSTLIIQTEAERYRAFLFNNRPQMDLHITLPKQSTGYNYEVKLKNGDFEASDITASNELSVSTTNGDVFITNIKANTYIETTNGEIEGSVVVGNVYMKTTNGDIEALELDGDVELRTTNGDIVLEGATGRVQLATTNGDIEIFDANRAVIASTTNGDIMIQSHSVGGDWNVKTNNGNIELKVPADGSFRVAGRTGNGKLRTDLDLKISKKEISGSIGSGTYLLDLTTQRAIEIFTLN